MPSLSLAGSVTLDLGFQLFSHIPPKELTLFLLFHGSLLGKLSYVLANQFPPNIPN